MLNHGAGGDQDYIAGLLPPKRKVIVDGATIAPSFMNPCHAGLLFLSATNTLKIRWSRAAGFSFLAAGFGFLLSRGRVLARIGESQKPLHTSVRFVILSTPIIPCQTQPQFHQEYASCSTRDNDLRRRPAGSMDEQANGQEALRLD